MIARAARRIAGRFQRAGLHRSSHEPRRPEPSRESVQQELERLREILRERGERISELEEQVEQQEKQIGEQAQEIAEAEKKIADLERQLALRQRNSTNSSKPPSSDGLAGAQRPRGRPQKKKTQRRRKPGGQKGHPGHFPPLVPVEQVQHVVDLFPDRCQGCQQLLPADPAERMTEGEPGRYQVTELPPLQPDITEYRRHKVVGGDCGGGWGLRGGDAGGAAGRGAGSVWSAVDRSDRLSDGGVSGAAPAGARLVGFGVGYRAGVGKDRT